MSLCFSYVVIYIYIYIYLSFVFGVCVYRWSGTLPQCGAQPIVRLRNVCLHEGGRVHPRGCRRDLHAYFLCVRSVHRGYEGCNEGYE